MSKSHRMFTIIVTCVYLGVTSAAWQPVIALPWGNPATNRIGLMAVALLLIILGGLVTAERRLRRLIWPRKGRS